MDGNGRWASARSLPVGDGHREGARALRRTVEAAIDLGIESLAVYAFSTENWARPPDEVESIIELLDETIDRELPDLAKQGVRTRFFGRRDRVPDRAAGEDGEARGRDRASRTTPALDRLRLRRPRRARRGSSSPASRTVWRRTTCPRTALVARLYAPELPDPDLVIRTSGEQRISNFLLWQSAYAELVFDDTLWPDFGEERLRSALEEYASRARRFGAER